MSIDVAVVPVAGLGTRLLPLTRSVPKELLPLGGKPVLQHVVEELKAAGIKQIIMVTGVGADSIKQHFAADSDILRQLQQKGKSTLLAQLQSLTTDIRIDYVTQPHQLGLGDAVLCARDAVGDRPFTIALGDAMIGLNGDASLCQRLHNVFSNSAADAAVAFEEVPLHRVNRYGVAGVGARNIDDQGSFEVTDLVEKPQQDDAPSRYAIAARYVCRSEVFSILGRTARGVGNEIQLTDALRSLLKAGGKVVGVPLRSTEKRYDVGNFESYYTSFVQAACADPVYGASLKQHLRQLLNDTDAG